MIRPVAAIAAGALVLAGFAMPQAAAHHTPEPRSITLVKAETGVALESLRWSSAGSARGQLDCTGESAGQIGPVRVTVRRDGSGDITSLRLAGNTDGIAKSWTLRHGHWNAS